MLSKLLRFAAPVVAIALFALAPPASAHSILYTTGSLATSPAGPNTTWSYNFNVTSDGQVETGDLFVIVDFGGYVAGSAFAPAGWTPSVVGFTGTVSAGVSSSTVADSAGVTNLVFTYAGATLVGPQDLGAFGATTTLKGQTGGSLLAIDHSQSGGVPETNSGALPGPVPLPATANMGIALLVCLAGAGVWRKLKSSQAVA
jgi:hypothetical protein